MSIRKIWVLLFCCILTVSIIPINAFTVKGDDGEDKVLVQSASFNNIVVPTANAKANETFYPDNLEGIIMSTAVWYRVLYTGASEQEYMKRDYTDIFENNSIYCLDISINADSSDGYYLSDDFNIELPKKLEAKAIKTDAGNLELIKNQSGDIVGATRQLWFRVGSPKTDIKDINGIEAYRVDAPEVNKDCAKWDNNNFRWNYYDSDKIQSGDVDYSVDLIEWRSLGDKKRKLPWPFVKSIVEDGKTYRIDGYSVDLDFMPNETGNKFKENSLIKVNGNEIGKVPNTDSCARVRTTVTWYTVHDPDGFDEHGTLESDQDFVMPGEIVGLTAKPDKGYKFEAFHVREVKTDSHNQQIIGEDVAIDKNGNFVMPDSAVSISADFVKDGSDTPDESETDRDSDTPSGDYTPDKGKDNKTPTEKSENALNKTEQKVLNQKTDADIAGSEFGVLQAKATKTTKSFVKLSWKKVAGAKGYIIYGNKCGKKNKYKKLATVSGSKKTWTNKKLKKGTYYKYIVVAYKQQNKVNVTDSVSKTIHVATDGGKVGNYKKVSLNKKKITLKKKKSFLIKAKAVKKKLKVKKHRKICFESSDTKVATVTSKGKIKAIAKGTCYIYAYSQSGVYAKIKVTVKN